MRKAVRIAFVQALMFSAAALCAGEAPRPATAPVPPSAPLIPKVASSSEKSDPSDDMSAPANYDEVVRDLVDQLMNRREMVKKKEVLRSFKKKEEEQRDVVNDKEQFTVNAQDAARKLASLGKRAVPDLSILFKANYNRPAKEAGAERAAQVAYYAAWALARIRTAEAARVLMPLMTDPTAPTDLRLIAVDAAGWEKCEDGVAALEKVATGDADIEMRKHALGQLAMIPEFWQRTEPIFVKALSDPNEEIRVQAAKACHFSHRFSSANVKLVELLEKDTVPSVRMYAMLTVSRLKVVKAEPALVRVLQQPSLDEKLSKQALVAMTGITGIPFRSVESVFTWWEKSGRQEYDNFAQTEKLSDERAADIKSQRPIKIAPKSLNNNAIEPAGEIVDAEVVPLEKLVNGSQEKPAAQAPPVSEAPIIPAKIVKPAPEIPYVENLSPNESSGSQRRRTQKKE